MSLSMSDYPDGRAMLTTRRKDNLYLLGVRERAISEGRAHLTFFTTRRDLEAYARIERNTRQAVILLGGDEREPVFDSELDLLSSDLAQQGIGSVLVDYRYPGDCAQCAIDALLACQYLDDEGVSDVLLVGWSFGASIALAAGSVARIARGVAAISPIEVAECCVRRMRKKPLLIMRGDADELSRSEILRRTPLSADSPMRVLTYKDPEHDLSGARRQVHADLMEWIGLTFESARRSKLDAIASASA